MARTSPTVQQSNPAGKVVNGTVHKRQQQPTPKPTGSSKKKKQVSAAKKSVAAEDVDRGAETKSVAARPAGEEGQESQSVAARPAGEDGQESQSVVEATINESGEALTKKVSHGLMRLESQRRWRSLAKKLGFLIVVGLVLWALWHCFGHLFPFETIQRYWDEIHFKLFETTAA